MLNILVSIKQVPDTTNIRINPETGTLIREGIPSITNPYDVVALSLACELKQRYGGKITVITMGPPQAKASLREAVEFGADRIILLCDKKFAGADTLATSYTLAETIKFLQKDDPFDLLLFGKQAIDGDTAQVGPGVANRLNIPVITYVIKLQDIDLINKKIIVHRKIERGVEVLEASLPVLLTCEKELCATPFVPLEQVIKATKAEPEVFTAEGPVIFTREKLGLKGSPTQVKKVFTPELKKQGKIYNLEEVPLEKVIEEIIGVLKEKGLL
ncbi:MAG: electron transfer flavoprotein subunit beta/FixA family protein [Caldimicrobium sp.]|nr:electron transfer flavoprotein subunit beta/FixA family protein [Caldimicrobium sp.]MCX7872942.1 electron transfer flavoprotein subunit beta/FixA family protein [Caldimicrobium sp.]MDW8094456.1 electron transfer flavoprotein subunit beta/FixA family protein [Caldimicrobium sp.]